ncbi:recombination-associated protein RdgC [Xanthomonas sacchari]|uniref:recombination-associated protein RdgC n=1 Tax=Xanthomonas sacchari TaxID=56458 RepID=UPI00225C3BAB|nr:recombination-associated protein RdgC [Xanthomonas sacchari]MCW0447221.1 Recombination-associated protein RdgC [Xanthomonas sacchari]
MFFRNLTFFRFPTSIDFSQVDALLPEAQLKPVDPMEMTSRGFVSPFGAGDEALSHQVGDFLWLTIGGQDKMLPGSVVNDHVARKIAETEEKECRRPSGRERKRIKDDVIAELLPRAFVRASRIDLFLDLEHGYVAVDTSSRKAGENAMSEIRRLLGSFPAMPVNAEVAPRSILTAWIAGEPLPVGLSMGEECQLQDPIQGGAVVRCQHQELRCDEIDKHLQAGKQVTRLALSMDDRISFVLGDDLVIRKLKFLQGAADEVDKASGDGVRAELDARFALMTGEVCQMFLVLEAAFKISTAGDQ